MPDPNYPQQPAPPPGFGQPGYNAIDAFKWATGGPLDHAVSAGHAYVGANPYQGGWDALIGQLRAQALGQGPSLAAQQYQRANQDAVANQLALSRAGRSPGMAYQAANNMSQLNQGLTQGITEARTREQLGAQGMLTGALTNAGAADFQRQQANQQAYLGLLNQQLQQPSQFDQMMNIGSQLAGTYAMFNPPKPGK